MGSFANCQDLLKQLSIICILIQKKQQKTKKKTFDKELKHRPFVFNAEKIIHQKLKHRLYFSFNTHLKKIINHFAFSPSITILLNIGKVELVTGGFCGISRQFLLKTEDSFFTTS